jgi:hypothetical protein
LYNFELVRKSVFEKNNFLDESLKMYEDWDFRIRYGIYAKVGYTGKILSAYRRTGNSISHRSSLSKRIRCRMQVIEKNRRLIESDETLRTFYKSFIKRSRLESLFDTTLNTKQHLMLCLKCFVQYPFSIVSIAKSIKYHRFVQKEKRSISAGAVQHIIA